MRDLIKKLEEAVGLAGLEFYLIDLKNPADIRQVRWPEVSAVLGVPSSVVPKNLADIGHLLAALEAKVGGKIEHGERGAVFGEVGIAFKEPESLISFGLQGSFYAHLNGGDSMEEILGFGTIELAGESGDLEDFDDVDGEIDLEGGFDTFVKNNEDIAKRTPYGVFMIENPSKWEHVIW